MEPVGIFVVRLQRVLMLRRAAERGLGVRFRFALSLSARLSISRHRRSTRWAARVAESRCAASASAAERISVISDLIDAERAVAGGGEQVRNSAFDEARS